MLIRDAQPTSFVRHTRRRLSAAGGALAAVIAILMPLALSEDSAAAASGSGAWPWPLLGEVITPYKNGSDPYAAGQHRGLDIAAPAGSPVLAIVDGRVSFSGRLPDGGETVTVASSDGAWLVSDLHLSARAVARGDSVHAGDLLGRVGTTGKRSAQQPHLHLGVRRAGSGAYVDPMTLLGPARIPSAPAKNPPPIASAQGPAVPVAHAQPERVRVTPLERGARQSANVHAHSPGDVSPASRHGAGSVTTRNPAGAPAREGHAADQATGRVAPPPLTVSDETGRRVVVAESAVAEAPIATAATGPRSLKRLLFVLVALVCVAALFLRRRSGTDVVPAPPVDTVAEEVDAAVLELDAFRRAGAES